MEGVGEDKQLLTPGARWLHAYFERTEEGLRHARESRTVLGGFICPCCFYPTLTERGGYEICPLCWWEDDGQDDPHAADVWGGPNHDYSLTEARENFKRYRTMYRPDNDRRISEGDSEKEQTAKQAACSAFDQMLAADREIPELMAVVERSYAILRDETTRKVAEYAARHKPHSEKISGADV